MNFDRGEPAMWVCVCMYALQFTRFLPLVRTRVHLHLPLHLSVHACVCLQRVFVWVTGSKLLSDSSTAAWNEIEVRSQISDLPSQSVIFNMLVVVHLCVQLWLCVNVCLRRVQFFLCVCVAFFVDSLACTYQTMSLSSRAVTHQHIYRRIAFVCLRGAVSFERPTVKYWIGRNTEIEPRWIISLGLEDQIFFTQWLHIAAAAWATSAHSWTVIGRAEVIDLIFWREILFFLLQCFHFNFEIEGLAFFPSLFEQKPCVLPSTSGLTHRMFFWKLTS